jgi:hypothetical protein
MTYTTRRGASRRRKPVTSGDLLALPTRERDDDGAIILHVGDHSPTCSDCGRGTLRWAEGGYVPWHRICDTCGSHWDLHPLGLGIAYVPQVEAPMCHREEMVEAACPDCDGPSESEWCERCESTGVVRRPHPERWCYDGDPVECARRAIVDDHSEVSAAMLPDEPVLRCSCCCHVPPSLRQIVGHLPSVWIDSEGWVPIDPEWPLGADLRGLAAGTCALLAPWIDDGGPRELEPDATRRTWGELVALVRAPHIAAAEREKERTMGVTCVPACWARRARFYGG